MAKTKTDIERVSILPEWITKYWIQWIFGLICAGLMAGYARLAKKLKRDRIKNQAIEDGLKGILRMKIIETYDKCVSNGRKISITWKDAIGEVYRSYVALCESQEEVDDTVKQLYEELVHMPIM